MAATKKCSVRGTAFTVGVLMRTGTKYLELGVGVQSDVQEGVIAK